MKLFSRIVFILVIPLFLIGTTNYFIDPDYILRQDYIPKVATALLNGNIVSGPVNTNVRQLKKEWIKLMSQSPDVLVLGSSRTMELNHTVFNSNILFNASVSNCTFQDMYAFVDLMEKNQGTVPREIVICCDQWLFGNSFMEKRWLYNRKNFINLLKLSGDIPPGLFPGKWELQKEWIKELFSARYFLRSVKLHGKTERFEVQDSIIQGKAMLLPDGSRIFYKNENGEKHNEVAKLAEDYFYLSYDEIFSELDPIQCQLFENLIVYLQRKNCKLSLFIPPYHPVTWQLLSESEKHDGIFEVDNYVHQIAKKHGLRLLGSTSASEIGLSALDFKDAVHLKKEALASLFSNYRKKN